MPTVMVLLHLVHEPGPLLWSKDLRGIGQRRHDALRSLLSEAQLVGTYSFQAGAIALNARRRRIIEDVAERLYVTPAQISLAWVLAKGVVPIPGTRHAAHLEDNVAAEEIAFDEETIAQLEAAFPPGSTAGERYPPDQMKLVPREPALA